MRQNLINALKHKDLGLCKNREARSAKQYVYDMLIAEYLLSYNYSFTLSIFASEVPLLVNFCNNVSQCSDNNDIGGRRKLQDDYIAHTLATLGINPNKPEGQHIISNYNNNEEPLLLSILNCIPSLIVDNTTSERKDSPVHNKQTQANLASEIYHADTVKLRAVSKKIMQQKQLYDNELRAKESKLKQQVSIMRQQFSSLNVKVEEAQVIFSIVYIVIYKFCTDQLFLYQYFMEHYLT